MNKKRFLLLIFSFFLYVSSYTVFRQTHIEIWEKDKNAYVIFPQDKILYYMYRPISLIDGRITGMRFHIGQHQ